MISRLRDEIQKLFFLTRSEANGYVVLLLAMLLLLFTPLTFDFWIKNNEVLTSQDIAKTDSLILAWEKEVIVEKKETKNSTIDYTKEKVTSDNHLKPTPSFHTKKVDIKKQHKPFDINLADTTLLQKIYGIGPVLSVRIVKFRDKLGGFHSTNQLYEVYGLDSTVASKLIKRCFVGNEFEVVKININEADFTTINAHPYISYEQTKAIVNYRRKHGAFNLIKDLLQNSLMDDQSFQKTLPYLTI